MSSLEIAIGVSGLMAASGIIGLLLQRWLKEHHTAERSRDMIGGVVGLLTLLLALVLGHLEVSVSYLVSISAIGCGCCAACGWSGPA